jgi:signal transduction histidine kinase
MMSGDNRREPPPNGDVRCEFRSLQVVCAEPDLTYRYLRELERGGCLSDFVVANSAAEARRNTGYAPPLLTLLDESALAADDSLSLSVALLCEVAPVVVVASSERRAELEACIRSGRIDFVSSGAGCVQTAAGLIEARLRTAESATRSDAPPAGPNRENFGERLRHEVNNPLTGILGNAELLLARPDTLPPGAAQRLETIAQLAVRLRETVRRLSDSWQ